MSAIKIFLRGCIGKGSPEKQSQQDACVCVCVCVLCACVHVGGRVVYETENLRLAYAIMGTTKSKF